MKNVSIAGERVEHDPSPWRDVDKLVSCRSMILPRFISFTRYLLLRCPLKTSLNFPIKIIGVEAVAAEQCFGTSDSKGSQLDIAIFVYINAGQKGLECYFLIDFPQLRSVLCEMGKCILCFVQWTTSKREKFRFPEFTFGGAIVLAIISNLFRGAKNGTLPSRLAV